MADKQTCFVVMGFGKKTDHRQGKTFDLDKTYRTIIKPAVEAAGLECIRADEIQHSGVIDLPMYEQLLNADVVVADLSTSNFNAAYELGIRHALKPYSTICMAESGFSFPFDVNHIVCLTYEHMESGIDFEEVEKMRAVLSASVKAATGANKVDSPVYTFLQQLAPPAWATQTDQTTAPKAEPNSRDEQKLPIAALRASAEAFKAAGDWSQAAKMWGLLAQMDHSEPFFTQQYALATYKSAEKMTDNASQPRAGYLAALTILEGLNPERSADPETLGLWAAVHKRLYEKSSANEDEQVRARYLDSAIQASHKGFVIRNDFYSGINLAYVLDLRGTISEGNEAITDHTQARRVRSKVVAICQKLVATEDYFIDDVTGENNEYWIKASAWEAFVGLGDQAAAQEWKNSALAVAGFQDWMRETTEQQIEKLVKMLPS